ncbi:phosphoribosylanthranilate isomerase [Burkholderia cepacia]|nr:phosphoribosylanthranilate isomerase [Burkholderia cepacia]
MTDHAVSPSTPAAAGLPPRAKLCGLSRPEDVLHAAALGADAIGLVFYPKSPRAVTIAQAAELARLAPPFVSVVGLFVNATEAEIEAVVRDVPLTLLVPWRRDTRAVRRPRPRGTPAVVARGARRPSTQPADLVESALHYSKARGLLFDTLVPDYGGSGKVFDWSLIPAELAHRAVLSGGLSAQNVGDAIRQLRPFAVDVSSGIEVEGAKGVKDHARMAAFVRAVREADAG